MFDDIVKDVSRFATRNFFAAELFKHFNYDLKTFIKITFMRHGGTLEEPLEALNSSAPIEKRKDNTGAETCKAKLVSNGKIINLVKLETSTLACLTQIDNGGGVLASE